MAHARNNNKSGHFRKPSPKHEGSISNDTTAHVDGYGSNGYGNGSAIDPHEPIPLELENIFGFSAGGDKYIPFFNGNNKFYGFNNFFINILNWRKESTTQNACIISKANFSVGDGIYVDGVEDAQIDPKFKDFLKRCNPKPQGLNRVLKQIIDNFYTFGNVPIEIVKGTIAGKKFLYVYAKNPLDCRKAWPNSFNESEAMIVSRWFRKKGVYNLTEKFNIRIPFYIMGAGDKRKYWIEDKKDNDGRTVSTGVFRTALWLKNDYAGYDHYGLPSWLPSMRSAMLEANAAQFNLDNIENNMVVGGVLVLAGSVTEKEAGRIANTITKKYTGKGKTGRTIVISSEDGITDSKYTPQSTYKEGSFKEMSEQSKQMIILANEWDESFLGGHDGASKAKSGAFLSELYQQKVKTVIKPLHRIIKDEFFAPLCEIADEWLGTKWGDYDLDIQISNLFDDTTEASTTVNGLNSLIEIISMVSNGQLPHENAIKLITMKYGMEETDAKGLIDGIQVKEQQVNINDPKPIDKNK